MRFSKNVKQFLRENNVNRPGTLYLIPCTLGDSDHSHVLPAYTSDLVNSLADFVVEHEKSARHFLKQAGFKTSFNDIRLYPLNEHTLKTDVITYLKPLLEGRSMGLISEAGCPAVADPGSELVKLAHANNIRVVPLVGPSSILLALMASGLNGQSFSFNGYLPKEKTERISKIKWLEKESQSKRQTQIFIETPYRNQHVLEDLIAFCSDETMLCIACNISLPAEFIRTKKIGEWKKNPMPDLYKRPAVFLLLR